MSDDDKTVFIQPGVPQSNQTGDRTIMVPRPGNRPIVQNTDSSINKSPPASSANPATLDSSDIVIQNGLNPLVVAASTILTVSSRLRTMLEHNDIPGLQRQLIDEIKKFEYSAKQKRVTPEQIVPARYLLCTMLDEIVLHTPWGANSRWSEHSLLSQFHNETGGGEKCFLVLQKMLEAPAQHLEVLELFYLCLGLGFAGKYKIDPQGKGHLEHISNTLFQTITNYRGEFEPDLSPNWSSATAPKRSMMQYIPLWVVTSCVLLVLLLTFSGFRLWLYQANEPSFELLTTLLQPADVLPESSNSD
jgi:type VI secretion system protein ImpK